MELLLVIFIFGLIIGSFLNCLIWRLHEEKSMGGRSICPKCKHQLAWYDNIPVLSFVLLRGKCRYCNEKISWQYPVVELVTGLLFLLDAYLNFKFQISNFILLFRDWFVISIMIVIFIYDLRWYLILDKVSLPACLIVFVLNLALGYDWKNLLISGIIGGSFFLVQYVISKGKWIGGGDIRLGLLMGLSLGWPGILAGLMISYLIGSVVGVWLIASKRMEWKSQVPMGVFLTVGTIIVLLWGEGIINWYLSALYLR